MQLHRNDVITQLEKYSIKNLYEEGTLCVTPPLPRERDRLKIAIGSVVDLRISAERFSAIRWFINGVDGRISVIARQESLLNHKNPKLFPENGLMIRQLTSRQN